jgi:ABC-type nitrate/sulfonate/bicarbonate transport system substrate-binding protein
MTTRNEGIIMGRGTLTATTLAVGRHARAETHQAGGAEEAERQEIARLLAALQEALRAAPAGRAEEAEALAAQAGQLAQTATQEQPNRTLLQMLGRGVAQTAELLRDTLPDAVGLAGQLATLVARLHGAGV